MLQRLVIKGLLCNLNTYISKERTNRYAAAALKKKETERVYWECKIQKLRPVEKIDELTITYYHPNNRSDYDNIEFGNKFLFDGLVLAGIIIDDSQKYTPSKRIYIHKHDKENPRIELEIITLEGTGGYSVSDVQGKTPHK